MDTTPKHKKKNKSKKNENKNRKNEAKKEFNKDEEIREQQRKLTINN